MVHARLRRRHPLGSPARGDHAVDQSSRVCGVAGEHRDVLQAVRAGSALRGVRRVRAALARGAARRRTRPPRRLRRRAGPAYRCACPSDRTPACCTAAAGVRHRASRSDACGSPTVTSCSRRRVRMASRHLGMPGPAGVGQCVRRELVDADQVVVRRHVDRYDRLAQTVGVPALEAQRADGSRDPQPVVLGQVTWVEPLLADPDSGLGENVVEPVASTTSLSTPSLRGIVRRTSARRLQRSAAHPVTPPKQGSTAAASRVRCVRIAPVDECRHVEALARAPVVTTRPRSCRPGDTRRSTCTGDTART